MNHLAPLVALSSLLIPTLLSTTALAAPNNQGYPGDGSDAPAPTTVETPRIFPSQAPSRDQVDTSVSAKAQPEPWDKRRLALYAHLALMRGPFGDAAFSVEFSPVPIVALEAGAGITPSGPQAALNTWLRPVRWQSFALLLGGGISTGNYSPFENADASDIRANIPKEYKDSIVRMVKSAGWFPAYWGNVEVAAEWAFGNGFRLRPYAGVSKILNTAPASEPPLMRELGMTPSKKALPFLGIQLGASFGL